MFFPWRRVLGALVRHFSLVLIGALALYAGYARGTIATLRAREAERERLLRVVSAQAKVVRTEYLTRVDTLYVYLKEAARVDTLWETVTVPARAPDVSPAAAQALLPAVVAAGDSLRRACSLVRRECPNALRLADLQQRLDSAARVTFALPPPRSCKPAFVAGVLLGGAGGAFALARARE